MSTTTRPAADRCLVVANPVAGQVTPDVIAQVTDRLGRSGATVWSRLTGHPGAARDIVADAVQSPRPPRLIVVAGGDGTAREAAEGLARALGRWPGCTPAGGAPDDVPALLFLPAGTGNSTARAIWGDRPWPEVIALALTGAEPVRVRRLDLLRIAEGDRAVLLGASAGFIAAVTAAALDHPEVTGRDRYLRALAETFGSYRPYPGTVAVDGRQVLAGATTLVTVGGARHRVGTFEVLPRSVLDDGRLDVCAVRGFTTEQERADLAQRIMSGTHVGYPGVAYAQGRQVTLTRTDGAAICFEHDGEMWAGDGGTVTIEVVPAAVPVLAPARPVAG